MEDNKNRSRVWFCTAYAHIDELLAEAQHKLRNLNGFITAFHDKDVKEDGTPKEPHYHIMISNPNAISYSTVYGIFKSVMDKHPNDNDNFKVDEMRGSWGQASAYMLHNDVKSREAGKHQYDKSCIHEYIGELNKTPEKNAASADYEPAMALMMCIANGYSFAECVIQFGAFAIFNYKKIAEGLMADCPCMAGIINRPKHTYDELMDILNCEKVSRETADYVDDFCPREENVKALKEAMEYRANEAWMKAENFKQALSETQNDENNCNYHGTADILHRGAEKAFAKCAQYTAEGEVDDPEEAPAVPTVIHKAYVDEEMDEFCPDDVTQHESDDLEEDAQEEVEIITEMLRDYEVSLPADVIKATVTKMLYDDNYDTHSCLEVLLKIGRGEE